MLNRQYKGIAPMIPNPLIDWRERIDVRVKATEPISGDAMSGSGKLPTDKQAKPLIFRKTVMS